MSKHTPGPWWAHDEDGCWLIGRDNHAEVLAEVHRRDEATDRADAMLIASAPSLLGICKSLIAAMGKESPSMKEIDAIVVHALRVVARAEGKP